jgi:hypothetical protein
MNGVRPNSDRPNQSTSMGLVSWAKSRNDKLRHGINRKVDSLYVGVDTRLTTLRADVRVTLI